MQVLNLIMNMLNREKHMKSKINCSLSDFHRHQLFVNFRDCNVFYSNVAILKKVLSGIVSDFSLKKYFDTPS